MSRATSVRDPKRHTKHYKPKKPLQKTDCDNPMVITEGHAHHMKDAHGGKMEHFSGITKHEGPVQCA